MITPAGVLPAPSTPWASPPGVGDCSLPCAKETIIVSDDRTQAALLLEEAYRKILTALEMMGYPVTTDDNFSETSGRAARAMLELIKPTTEIKDEIDRMLSRTFAARYDEMVISKHNV